MLIDYDKKVLEEARRIAAIPYSTQRDLAALVRDPYLSPDAHQEIRNIYVKLPRRKRNNYG